MSRDANLPDIPTLKANGGAPVISPERLSELRKDLEHASPGPWTVEGGMFPGADFPADDDHRGLVALFVRMPEPNLRYADARLIAAARNLVPDPCSAAT